MSKITTQDKKEVKFDYHSGKVERVFTNEWATSGFINVDKIPEMVKSVVEQRKSMVEYIEALHDKIDFIMEKNNLCQYCFIPNCTSDHK